MMRRHPSVAYDAALSPEAKLNPFATTSGTPAKNPAAGKSDFATRKREAMAAAARAEKAANEAENRAKQARLMSRKPERHEPLNLSFEFETKSVAVPVTPKAFLAYACMRPFQAYFLGGFLLFIYLFMHGRPHTPRGGPTVNGKMLIYCLIVPTFSTFTF